MDRGSWLSEFVQHSSQKTSRILLKIHWILYWFWLPKSSQNTFQKPPKIRSKSIEKSIKKSRQILIDFSLILSSKIAPETLPEPSQKTLEKTLRKIIENMSYFGNLLDKETGSAVGDIVVCLSASILVFLRACMSLYVSLRLSPSLCVSVHLSASLCVSVPQRRRRRRRRQRR